MRENFSKVATNHRISKPYVSPKPHRPGWKGQAGHGVRNDTVTDRWWTLFRTKTLAKAAYLSVYLMFVIIGTKFAIMKVYR